MGDRAVMRCPWRGSSWAYARQGGKPSLQIRNQDDRAPTGLAGDEMTLANFLIDGGSADVGDFTCLGN